MVNVQICLTQLKYSDNIGKISTEAGHTTLVGTP